MEPERTINLHFSKVMYKQAPDASGYRLSIFKVEDPAGKFGNERVYRFGPKYHRNMTVTAIGPVLNRFETTIGFAVSLTDCIPPDVLSFINDHFNIYKNYSIFYSIENTWDLPDSFDLVVTDFNNILNKNQINCKAVMSFNSSLSNFNLQIRNVRLRERLEGMNIDKHTAPIRSMNNEEVYKVYHQYQNKLGRYLVPGTFEIKDIKFSGIATIVFWNDNTKTVVKMDKTEKEFDVEKAIMAAYMKKALETMGGTAKERSLDEVLKKYTAKYEAEKKEAKKKSKKTKKKD